MTDRANLPGVLAPCYRCPEPSVGTVAKRGERRPVCKNHASALAMYDGDQTFRKHEPSAVADNERPLLTVVADSSDDPSDDVPPESDENQSVDNSNCPHEGVPCTICGES